jgi:hypothetical protein
MRAYNPKKKHFVYGLDLTGAPAIAAGARVTGRTPISSDSWFELHAISVHATEAAPAVPELLADNMYLNLFDESTGRDLFSEPVSLPAIIPSYGANVLVAAAPAGALNTYYPLIHKPFYFATPYLFRPGSVVRATLDNRDAALNMTTLRIYYHGVKVFDLGSRDQSPGAVFAPFSYLATFGSMLTGAQATVQIATQGDADFDVVSITTNLQTFNESCVDADQAFISFQDQTTGYQYQDRAISLAHFVGTPIVPYYPIRPIRISASGGLQATLNNTSGVTLANAQVAFNGYKIFR